MAKKVVPELDPSRDLAVLKSNITFTGSFTTSVSGATISYGDLTTETSDTPSHTYTSLPPYAINIKDIDNSSLTGISISGNSLTAVDVSKYKNLTNLNISDNLLPKSEIENLLKDLDASGITNGTFKGSDNVLDADLTTNGLLYKSNLEGKGWNIEGTQELWTPSQLTTQMWFDASDIDTIILNGSDVSQWDDKSGYDRHVSQGTATRQPAYDATGWDGTNPTVKFRTRQALTNNGNCLYRNLSGDGLPIDELTVFAVLHDLSNDTECWLLTTYNDGKENRWKLGTQGPDVASDGGNGGSANDAVMLREKQVLMMNLSSSCSVRQNGVQTAGNTSAYTYKDHTGNFVFGARGTNGHAGWNGDIGEMIYVAGALTTDEIERIEGYLAHKWGLEGRLPSSHQYKHNAPLSSEVKPTLFVPSDVSPTFWLDGSDETTISGLECQLGVLDLTQDGGLNYQTNEPWKAGDQYRLMFCTSGVISGGSTDIETYNDYAQTHAIAGGFGSVEWKALASTATVDAIDNTNTDISISGSVNCPIYSRAGTRFSFDTEHFWEGYIASNRDITEDENGNDPSGSTFYSGHNGTWTGTDGDGRASSPLGSATPNFGVGLQDGTKQWINRGSTSNTGLGHIYALSEPLTIQSKFDQWDDKSGNNNHATQTTQIDKPESGTVIDGKNAISFDSSYLQLTSQITTSRAVFVITESISGSSVASDVSPLFGEVTDLQDYTFVRTNNDDYDISIDGSLSTTGSASTNGNDVVSGTDIDLSLSQAQKADLRMWYVEFDSSVNIDFIGALENSSTFKLKGDMAEVIVLSSVPTTEVKQQLEGYLAHKWGLTANLPVSHPYKTLAP